MNRPRPRVLAVVPGLFPSTIVGVAKPLLRLHLQERITLDLKLPFVVGRRAIEQADVVVLCRELAPRFARILSWVEESGTPLIHELDDNLLDVPPGIPGLDYARDPERRALLLACLRRADLVRVYSPALRERLESCNSRIQLVTGPFDWDLIPTTLPPKDSKRVRIVYATSRLQDRIGSMVAAPLRRALDAFPQTELTVWGPHIAELSGHPRVRHLKAVSDYDQFVSRFVAESFDIGVAPLPDDIFHRGKSNNKFREYAACGVAGIYSDMPVYNQWVVDGETGLLAPEGDHAWFNALERLIASADLRRHIAHHAREFARAHFNQDTTDREWMAGIEPLLSGAGARRPTSQVERPTPLLSPRGRSAARTIAGQVVEGARTVLGTLRRDGLRAASRRAMGPLVSVAQLAAWEYRRWRLEQRVSMQRGRS